MAIAAEYNGIAGAVCINCSTVVLVVVTDAHYTAKMAFCPAVTDRGFFCESPMATMDIKEIDMAVLSYVDINLAGTDLDNLRATVPNALGEDE